MISKSQIKTITGLQQKKYRDKAGLFVAEGPKVIEDLLASGCKLRALFATEKPSYSLDVYQEITEGELKKISFLKTPHTSLALFEIPETKPYKDTGLILVLDGVRDPGNLGTIIRLCDWFGVTQLICSTDSANCYNPKVVQATMGSIARISIHYMELEGFLQKTSLPVYGGCMEGENLYHQKLAEQAVVVLGNEGKGISAEVERLLTHQITIPQFGVVKETESLNVATAGAILLSEFKRSTET